MNATISAAHTTGPTVGGRRRGLRVAAISAGFGLLTLGLVACGNGSSGTAGGTTTPAASTSASSTSSAAAGADGVVTVGDAPVVVALAMSNGTKVGTATVKPGGSISVDSTSSDDTPDDPSGVDVVTRIVDAGGAQVGTITVRPDGSVISISGSGSVTTGSGSAPAMSMPPMSMDMDMDMDMSGMPTPPSRPGDQVIDSVNTGGAPTTIVSTSCSPDGSQCSRQEIVQN